MTTARRTRQVPSAKVADETAVTTFSSDLLTPEEERELLTNFWDCKNELVRVLLRHFPDLRANRLRDLLVSEHDIAAARLAVASARIDPLAGEPGVGIALGAIEKPAPSTP